MVDRDQWLFELSQLERTPSSSFEPSTRASSSRRHQGMTQQEELKQRKLGVELLASICARLTELDPTQNEEFRQKRQIDLRGGRVVQEWIGQNQFYGNGLGPGAAAARKHGEIKHWLKLHREYIELPMAKDVVTTASILMHRFYMRHSLQDYSIYEIAPTCLYLALKVEERMQIKITAVARAVKNKLASDNVQVFIAGKSLERTAQWEDLIAANEEVLLEALCYDMHVDQPLACLLKAVERLTGKGVKQGSEAAHATYSLPASQATDLAYTICYDTIFSPLCLLAEAQLIAASSLAAAHLVLGESELDTIVSEDWLDAFQTHESRAVNSKKSSSKSDQIAALRQRIRRSIATMKDFVAQGLMTPALQDRLDVPEAISSTEPEARPATADSPTQENASESAAILDAQMSNGLVNDGQHKRAPGSAAAPDAGLSDEESGVDAQGAPMNVGTVAPGRQLADLMGRDVADTASQLLNAKAKE